ncbi:MAG: cupin [Capsulimonas sp.]|jgi:quercetin dioxygenase-like cupin family protein|nr:cupin [Capsulimonas sp.]
MNNIADSMVETDASLGAYMIPSGMGPFFDMGDHRGRLKVGADATAGAFIFAEVHADQGGGVPPHIHSREDETFYILEGRFAFQIGDETVIANVGDTVFAPRRVAHAWFCVSPGGGRATMLITPGRNFEEFVTAMAQYGFVPKEAMSGPDAASFVRLAARHGIEMLPHALRDK